MTISRKNIVYVIQSQSEFGGNIFSVIDSTVNSTKNENFRKILK